MKKEKKEKKKILYYKVEKKIKSIYININTQNLKPLFLF